MSKSLKFRSVLVILCLLLSFFAIAPTLMRDSLPQWWTDSFSPIQLGLDLQGGMHLVLGVDVDKAVESRIDTILDQSEAQLREKDIIFKRLERRQGDRLVILVYDDEEGTKVDALMADDYPSLEAETFTGAGGYIEKHFRLSDREIENIKDYAVRQALETMRNRIDQF
ncbi:MAG: protein translocase subunit SecD, partial [Desulfuromusa sp.]|nr:protein translocase subunit SecD [Desulfuromusa sp.]